MKIGKIDKRDYAFGLTWVDSSYSIADAIESKSSGQAWYVAFVDKAEGAYTVGFTEEPIKGKLASYAATLAAVAEDGIYVAEVESGDYWYVNVHRRRVVAGTDVTVPASEIVDVVTALRDSLGVQLFVSGEAVVDVPGSREWDPVRAVRAARPAWLKKHGGNSASQVVAALLILGLGLGGLYFAVETLSPEPVVQQGPTPEEIRAMYLANVRSSLGQVPGQISWVSRAINVSRETFPPFKGGWALNKISCSAAGCSASYQRERTSPWSSPELLLGMGVAGNVADDLSNASLSAMVESVQLDPTDEEILNYPRVGRDLRDMLGVFGVRFPGIAIMGAPSRIRLDTQQPEVPPDARPLWIERVSFSSGGVPEPYLVRKINAFFAAEGFRAANLSMSRGYGTDPSGWSIEFVRLTGEG